MRQADRRGGGARSASALQEIGVAFPEQSDLLQIASQHGAMRHTAGSRESQWADLVGATMSRLCGDELGGDERTGGAGEYIMDTIHRC